MLYQKYIRLTFNSYISDHDFFQDHAHYRHELVFFGRFSRPKGDAHNETLNTVAFFLIKTKRRCYSYLSLLHESTFFVCMWTLLLFLMSVHAYFLMVFNTTFNNISAISWRSVLLGRKPPTCRKSLTNFITNCCIKYTSH
jgi:hypothetical protein